MESRRYPTVVLLAAAIAVALGSYGWYDSRGLDRRRSVTVADLEAGQPAPGRWLEVTGKLLADDRIIWGADEPRDTYVPIVSTDWQSGNPVAVFARAIDARSGEPARLLHREEPTVSGVVDRAGLPDDVRSFFMKADCPPAANALVLDFDAEPGAVVHVSRIAVMGGIILMAVAGWGVSRRGGGSGEGLASQER